MSVVTLVGLHLTYQKGSYDTKVLPLQTAEVHELLSWLSGCFVRCPSAVS